MEKTASIRISAISMDEFEHIHDDPAHDLSWNCLFVLPVWLKNWWQVFGAGKRQMILAVRSESTLLGIAPLMIEKQIATFMGNESVCDYQDMILSDNCPDDFFSHILDYLKKMDVRRIKLGALRPDSRVLSALSKSAERMGYPVIRDPAERVYALELPKTWSEYLDMLNGKQRHEVRRKIRRLYEAGRIRYHIADNTKPVNAAFNEFLSLFQAARKDKAEFLTDRMASFFFSLAKRMAERNMLQLGFLSVDGKCAASTFCFEYADTVYLYNNGYHPEFSYLSAGSLSKIFSIKHNIEKKMACYNFLKGDEAYKERLGGQPIPLSRLIINLSGS